MAYPSDIPTRDVQAGPDLVLESGQPVTVHAKAEATRDLIWDTSGVRLAALGAAAASPTPGEPATLTLPCTDTDGWRTDAGEWILLPTPESRTHAYDITVWLLDSAGRTLEQRIYKRVDVPAGEGPILLDLLLPSTTVDGERINIPDEWGRLVQQAEQSAQQAASAMIDSDSFIATQIATPGTQTNTELSNTFVGSTDRRPLLGYQAAAATASATPLDILTLGSSMWEGSGATTAENSCVRRAIARVRRHLGLTGGRGYVPARYTSPSLAAAGWIREGRVQDNSYGLGKRAVTMLLDGGTGQGDTTMTITVDCSSFDLLAHQESGGGTSLFVSVDGGAAAVWDIPQGAGVVKRNSGALAPGSHTITVTARSSRGTYFEGGVFYKGDETSGVRIIEGARSGSAARDFVTSRGGNEFWADSLAHFTPDIAVIEWLPNDYLVRTPSQYKGDLEAVIALLRGRFANLPILLWAIQERADQSGLAPWADYVAQMRAVADDGVNIAFHDMGNSVPKLSPDTYGLLYDPVHYNDKGHAMVGEILGSYLIPQ